MSPDPSQASAGAAAAGPICRRPSRHGLGKARASFASTQMLFATKTPAREKLPWQWTASVAVVMVLVMSFLAYKLFGPR